MSCNEPVQNGCKVIYEMFHIFINSHKNLYHHTEKKKQINSKNYVLNKNRILLYKFTS